MTDEWHYTNAEHTEARKGRWVVGRKNSDTIFAAHDDFPGTEGVESINWPGKNVRKKAHHRVAGEQIDSFLAWHAAQPAPIAVGDYVRLTGESWGDATFPERGSVHLVSRGGAEPEFKWNGRTFSIWQDEEEDYSAERLTVTADLDDPWNLPRPEVGEYVWVYTRGTGHVRGRVSNSAGRAVYVDGFGYVGSFLGTSISDYQITAWGTYDPADLTPAEPTTFGYVGYVTDADGDVWDLLRDGEGDFMGVLRSEVVGYQVIKWPDVLALGTFTAVDRA